MSTRPRQRYRSPARFPMPLSRRSHRHGPPDVGQPADGQRRSSIPKSRNRRKYRSAFVPCRTAKSSAYTEHHEDRHRLHHHLSLPVNDAAEILRAFAFPRKLGDKKFTCEDHHHPRRHAVMVYAANFNIRNDRYCRNRRTSSAQFVLLHTVQPDPGQQRKDPNPMRIQPYGKGRPTMRWTTPRTTAMAPTQRRRGSALASTLREYPLRVRRTDGPSA